MEIISEKSFEIILRDYKNKELKISVNINIVSEKGIKYYQLSYLYNDKDMIEMENFLDFKNKRVNKILVIKNSLTDKMYEYLDMSDNNLSKFTGTTTPLEYKKRLLILFMKLSE